MELSQMLAMVDHTLLKPESTWAQIKAICDDAMKYHTATVCIPACYVARCKAYMQDRADKVGVCTVIGFPTGYSTTETKVFEAADAVKNGADEVDMVIDVGSALAGEFDEARPSDVEAVTNALRRVAAERDKEMAEVTDGGGEASLPHQPAADAGGGTAPAESTAAE